MAMTAARLRLVDEAKGDTASKRRAAAARGDGAEAPAPGQSVPDPKAPGQKAPGQKAPGQKAARGPSAESEVVPRQEADPASGQRVRAGKRASTVADVMRSPAVCCSLNDSLHRVAQLMWEHDVGVVVVVDDAGKALHVITDRDVCMGVYTQGVALWASNVQSVKPAPLVCCSSEAGVVDARRLMQEHGVRRIPVVDDAGFVVGVVGFGDLVREATISTPKARTRGLTAPQLAQTLTAVYEDVPVPPDRALAR
jgi:CBS domain-containing protein